MKNKALKCVLFIALAVLLLGALILVTLSPLWLKEDYTTASAEDINSDLSPVTGVGYYSPGPAVNLGGRYWSDPGYNAITLSNTADSPVTMNCTLYWSTQSTGSNVATDDGHFASYEFTMSYGQVVFLYLPDLGIIQSGSNEPLLYMSSYCYLYITFDVQSGYPSVTSTYIGYNIFSINSADESHEQGYQAGYDAGYDVGYEEGISDNSGLSESYNQGYNAGYSVGLTQGQATTWENLNVVGLFLAPVNSFLSTPIFGSFSIGTALSVVLVVLLGAIFIKMFAGG